MTNDPDGSRKLRLLVLTSTYPRWAGDPEPGFIHELARRLSDRFEVTVLGPHAPGAAREEMLDGVRIIRFRYAPARLETLVNDGGMLNNVRRMPWKWLLVPGFLLSASWNAWRLMRRWKPQVLHAHWLLPQGLVAAVLATLDRSTPPLVVTSHGSDLYALQAGGLKMLKRFVARQAACVTVVSDAMRIELVRKGVDPAKVVVEPMGVDLAGRFRLDAATARQRNELLFVGRLVKGKGVHHLVKAMPAIARRHPSARLTIVGSGPEEAALRACVASLQLNARVDFLGAVTQEALPRLYQRATVFVAPFSVDAQEGLGLVLVEAAACGCPVVAGDLAAVRDVVRDETVGTLVPAGDEQALAEAICAVLSMPGESPDRTLARTRAVAHFDWQLRARAYADLLAAQVQG